MWQSPDLKRRAQFMAERAARERSKKKTSFRLRKTTAELRATPADAPPIQSSAQVLLNDITARGMHLFCDYEVPTGEFVEITISEPRRVYVRARVSFCQEITSEIRVISAHPFPFRMSVDFLFSSEEEEREFKAFADEVALELKEPTRSSVERA